MNGKSMLVSAPGKVIIHGEHAVVYGKKAFACSLDVRTFLKVTEASDGKVKVALPDIDIDKSWDLTSLLSSLKLPLCDVHKPERASAELLDKLKSLADIPPDSDDTRSLALVSFLYLFCSITADESASHLPCVHITITSALPPGAGLGSSAAYSTCLAASLLSIRGLISIIPQSESTQEVTWQSHDLELINGWAFESERILHGNPSGIDNSVSTYGGGLVFQKGHITPLTSIPNLKILLVNTKIPRSTKTLVAGVRQKLDKYPSIVQPVLDSIEAIADTSLQLVQVNHESGESVSEYPLQLMELVRMNQKHLDFLGVSHPTIDTICRVAHKHRLSAKLTGAGGGGCAFVLLHCDTPADTVRELQQELEGQDFCVWETSLGGSGVLCHLSTDSQVYTVPSRLT